MRCFAAKPKVSLRAGSTAGRAGQVYVPILGNIRNYNLANTVSVVLAHASLRAGIYDGT